MHWIAVIPNVYSALERRYLENPPSKKKDLLRMWTTHLIDAATV
jgi:hypothetical protein